MKLLFIEDDEKIARFVIKGLQYAGFSVDHAEDGEKGLHLALTGSYDALLVDIMLPKLNGLTLIEKLRNDKVMTPILILSSKDTVDDRVKGLQTGGDDYLVKPFAFTELLARVHALIRRAHATEETTTLTVGDISIDFIKRKVIRSGNTIELQLREFVLLEYLMRNAGRVLSQTMILEHVWDYDFDPQTNVVEVLVHRLREKIDYPFEKKMIHTIRGVGYTIKEE